MSQPRGARPGRRGGRRQGRRAAIGAAVLLAFGLLLALVPVRASAAAPTGTPFSATKTLTRTNLVKGVSTTLDTRTVTVDVANTAGLRDRQEVDVTWSGAHPTGGIVGDVNSVYGQEEEYPMVLLECRGVDSTTVPAAQQITPASCYTQTPAERYQSVYGDEFPPYRLDRYAAVADRAATVNQPTVLPTACGPQEDQPPVSHWLPFDALDGDVYYNGPNGCAGLAPEQSILDNTGFPANATYGITTSNGTGSADFVIQTSDSNASLGCSDTVPCSLVAVPIMGISCDPDAKGLPASDVPTAAELAVDGPECAATGAYDPGQPDDNPCQCEDLAVAGALWWSASNWNGRISVPLSFATPSNVCSSASTQNAINVYGSGLMYEAALQWQPTFCLNPKSFDWNLVTTSEPEAANLLNTGQVDAAYTSQPPSGGYSAPVVQAPSAVSGFAIAYDIDTATQHQVGVLHLDARLLAKLLTDSYPGDDFMKEDDPGLASNPVDISQDPEFQALNPGVARTMQVGEPGAVLLQVSETSDVISALTTYINSDPEARAWLNGTPDPWGMKVNPAYKGIVLPLDRWPLLDTVEPSEELHGTSNPCYSQNPSPWMSLVANPSPNFQTVAFDMQYALAQSETVCYTPNPTSFAGAELVTLGRQEPGYEFMLGVVSLADASEYQLGTASLQTHNTAAVGAAFSASTRTFVAPTATSMLAAAKSLVPNQATGTWELPQGSAANPAAYPGTMLVNLAVPTRGLSATNASDLSQLITFGASTGQVQGDGNGQLPGGYLPITSAEGLSALVNYAKTAAAAVAAQKGVIPPLVPPATVTTSASSSTPADMGGGDTSVEATTTTAATAPAALVPTPSTSEPAPEVAPSNVAAAIHQNESLPALLQSVVQSGPLGLLIPFLLLGMVVALLLARISGRFTRGSHTQ